MTNKQIIIKKKKKKQIKKNQFEICANKERKTSCCLKIQSETD